MHEPAGVGTSLKSVSRSKSTAIVLCAVVVAYFYLLDRQWFSSSGFSPIFRRLLTVYDVQSAWVCLVICVIAACWSRHTFFLRLVRWLGDHPRGCAILSVPLFSAASVIIYRGYPLSMDEYAAVFQSKIFAAGHIFTILPSHLVDWLVVRGFNGTFLLASTENGRAIEHYWPGFALLLAPFELLGVPWLCNALLAGLALYFVHAITYEITRDRHAAGCAMLFAACSGAFVADAISYYSMQAHLTANLAFASLLMGSSRYRAFCAGLVGSIALILHNPFPHALFAAPWIVAMIMQADRRRCLIALGAGYLPGLAILVLWSFLRSDIAASAHLVSTTGGMLHDAFTWPDAEIFNMRIAAVVKLWLWAVPCLFLFAVSGFVQYKANRYVRLMAQSALVTLVAYVFVRFDQGHGWGYRYFHSAWGIVPILAGCAMSANHGSYQRLAPFAAAATLLAFLTLLPLQLHQMSYVIASHRAQLQSPARPGENVYFIHPGAGDYLADMVQMDPFLRQADLLLVSHGDALDTQFVHRYWPNAVKISSVPAADEWHVASSPLERQFTFSQQ